MPMGRAFATVAVLCLPLAAGFSAAATRTSVHATAARNVERPRHHVLAAAPVPLAPPRSARPPLLRRVARAAGGALIGALAPLGIAAAGTSVSFGTVPLMARLSYSLKQLLLKSGKDGKKTVFLFDDTQIVMETFVEDINNILNAGEVPNLMKDEDMGQILDAMTPLCQDKGRR
jgi:hypothetical protein